MRLVLHIGVSNFNQLYASQWGEAPVHLFSEFGPLDHYFSTIQRPILDTMAALVLHNLFGRFPGLQMMVTEWGSDWVKPLMKLTDKAATFGRGGTWLGGRLTDKPSDVIRNHLHVAPYYEDDLREVIDLLGADRVLFGSDYPHAEGLSEPLNMMRYLGALTEHETRRFMRDNAAEMLGLKLAPTPA